MLILTSVVKDFSLYFTFKLKQSYIAQNICVNKEKVPTCQGRCFLNAQIEKSNQNNETKYLVAPLILADTFFCYFFKAKPNNKEQIPKIRNSRWGTDYSLHFIFEIFRPPQSNGYSFNLPKGFNFLNGINLLFNQ